MIEKINNFLDKFLKWKVLLNIILSEICIFPYVFFISMYKIPSLFNLIMIFSLNFSLMFWTRALKEMFDIS